MSIRLKVMDILKQTEPLDDLFRLLQQTNENQQDVVTDAILYVLEYKHDWSNLNLFIRRWNKQKFAIDFLTRMRTRVQQPMKSDDVLNLDQIFNQLKRLSNIYEIKKSPQKLRKIGQHQQAYLKNYDKVKQYNNTINQADINKQNNIDSNIQKQFKVKQNQGNLKKRLFKFTTENTQLDEQLKKKKELKQNENKNLYLKNNIELKNIQENIKSNINQKNKLVNEPKTRSVEEIFSFLEAIPPKNQILPIKQQQIKKKIQQIVPKTATKQINHQINPNELSFSFSPIVRRQEIKFIKEASRPAEIKPIEFQIIKNQNAIKSKKKMIEQHNIKTHKNTHKQLFSPDTMQYLKHRSKKKYYLTELQKKLNINHIQKLIKSLRSQKNQIS